jgi:hypothetical protein
MFEWRQLGTWVEHLLDETRSASISLTRFVRTRGRIGLDLEVRMDGNPLLELLELQAHHLAEVRMIGFRCPAALYTRHTRLLSNRLSSGTSPSEFAHYIT